MVEEHGVDYVLGKGPSSKDSSPATRLKGSMQQSVAASARIAPDPAEVDNIVYISINQLLEDEEMDSPDDADVQIGQTEGDDESASEPDSEFDASNPPVFEPVVFESIVAEEVLEEPITDAEPVDSSMADAVSQLEISLAELSMQDFNQDAAEVEEPEGEYSFLHSPGGSDRTSTPPPPQRFLDDSMLDASTVDARGNKERADTGVPRLGSVYLPFSDFTWKKFGANNPPRTPSSIGWNLNSSNG